MAVMRYTKQRPQVVHPHERTVRKKAIARRMFFLHQAGPTFLVIVGLLVLSSVFVPILLSRLFPETQIQADAQELSDENATSQTTTALAIHHEELLPTIAPTPVVIAETLDYTDLADWFPEHVVPVIAPQEAKTYLLSIPKIGIQDASVVYGGRNLDQHLIQYPDTGMPGEVGSPVIFGHSILRQFYNPKLDNPRRYISIFSTIMTLKIGDPIYIRDGTITYTYRVKEKTEVKPTDLFILDQDKNSRELKLVTCTPEGTTLRRGVVTAVLDEN